MQRVQRSASHCHCINALSNKYVERDVNVLHLSVSIVRHTLAWPIEYDQPIIIMWK